MLHLQDPQGSEDISTALGSQVRGAHVVGVAGVVVVVVVVVIKAHLIKSCSLQIF